MSGNQHVRDGIYILQRKKMTLPFNRLWSNRTNGKAITLHKCSIENLQENKTEI
jgi:hypothetical protein